jgi:hypothetical protein
MTRSFTPFWPVLQQHHQRRLLSFESFFQKQPTQSSPTQQQPHQHPYKSPQPPPQKHEQSIRVGTNHISTNEEQYKNNNVNRNRISNNNIGNNNNSGPSTAWTAYGTSTRTNATTHDKQQPQQRQQPDRPWRSSTRVTNQQPAPASSFNLYRQQQQQQQQHNSTNYQIQQLKNNVHHGVYALMIVMVLTYR